MLTAVAVAGPKPSDGVSGTWEVTYQDGGKNTVFLYLGKHETTVCGYYMTKTSGVADGYVSLKLDGAKATGPWTETTSRFGKTELAFAGGAVKGGWTGGADETAMLPLAGTYKGNGGSIGTKLSGRYRYKASDGFTCTMNVVQKGNLITATGTFDSDDSDCGTWKGTLAGTMIVGAWTTTNKEVAYPAGHFYLIVSGSKTMPWMAGMSGADETDGRPSCDNVGKIRFDKL
jgi:hypothetical protein